MSDLPHEADVAVVVFVKSRGVNQGDAEDRAVIAIRKALFGARPIPLPANLHSDLVDVTLEVYDVTEVGVAAGNGYLWTKPTSKARRERGGQ